MFGWKQSLRSIVIFLTIGLLAGNGSSQDKTAPAADAAQAKAAYDKAFNEYKDAIRQIEQLRVDYQTADAATREKINAELPGRAARAKSLVAAMVDAALEWYRLAPNADPSVTELLVAVAKHYVVGQVTGAPEPAGAPPEQQQFPTEGGDQYERALPIIKQLVDGGATEKNLYLWGFLSAFCTNDYDLADEYWKKVVESKAQDALVKLAGDASNPEAGIARQLSRTVENYASAVDKYRELWAKETKLREAEAAANDLPRVKLTTTKGDITLELFENEAPGSVANFITLVKQGFYDGSPFHRVLPMFMAQGGGKPDGDPGGPGYKIRCECYRPDYRHHFRGALSMAHAGRDTGSSQFFLTFVPTGHLDGAHTVFGRVMEGMEVLGEIQKINPQQRANPAKPDRITKAVVLRDRGHEYKFERLPE